MSEAHETDFPPLCKGRLGGVEMETESSMVTNTSMRRMPVSAAFACLVWLVSLMGCATIDTKPLGYAAMMGDVNGVVMLLNKGWDVNERGEIGLTPLHWATIQGFVDIARVLLDRGADVNAAAPGGTPLHYAAGQGRLNVVRLLVERGGDPSRKDSKGNSPANLANQAGHTDVAQFLREAEARVGQGQPPGQAPSLPAPTRVPGPEPPPPPIY